LKNCNNWKVLAIKACDRLDNLHSLITFGTTVEFQKKQINDTKEHYFELFDKLLRLCPEAHIVNVRFIRDEIRRLVERYSAIIEVQELQVKSPDEGRCPTCNSYPRRASCPIKCDEI